MLTESLMLAIALAIRDELAKAGAHACACAIVIATPEGEFRVAGNRNTETLDYMLRLGQKGLREGGNYHPIQGGNNGESV